MGYRDEQFTVQNEPEWSPVRWAFNVWTWILIVGAVAAFELFGDPLAAGLVLCLKFGGRDLRAAYLFRYYDSFANRGVMLSYFCFGLAFLKIAGAGILVMIVVTATAPLFGGAPGQFNRFLAGLVLQFGGVFLALAAIVAGSLQTGPANVRPWLDRTLYKNLHWRNPVLRCDGSRNRIWGLLIAGIIVSSMMFLPPLVVLVIQAIGARNLDPKDIPGLLTMPVIWLLTMWLWLGTWRFVARKPAECWPEFAGTELDAGCDSIRPPHDERWNGASEQSE